MPGFLTDYTKSIAAAIPAYYTDNYDAARFGPQPADWHSIAGRIRSGLAQLGFITVGRAKQIVLSGMQFVEPHLSNLEWLYSHLADEESREILVKLVAFRALGHRKIKLPINCPEHWERIRTAEILAVGGEQVDPGFLGWKLTRMNLRQIGYPIELYFTPGGVVIDFIEQQYRCKTLDGPIECADGDVAIDAGGCWGDTALYFAHKVGGNGKVASFEFLPDNLRIYEMNLGLNPELAKRIRLFKNPVWSCSGAELFVKVNGPGTTVGDKPGGQNELKVQTRSIDDLVNRGELGRVDFIKMDIEGAELAALRGAERVLRQFKPKLAITVYHDFKDFWTIPKYLEQLGLDYRFCLRHFTIHAEETVLFAKALI
jgi:FkbM family methyltransferase